MPRLVAAGVADGLLALAVGPAGAVGDQLAVVAGEQVADDRFERVQLAVGGVRQLGVDVVAQAEVAALTVGSPGPFGLAALAVLGGGVAQLVVLELGAGEVRLLARRRLVAVVLELFAGEVEHEHGVDHPDRVGEVLPALVHERVAPGTGPGRGRPW